MTQLSLLGDFQEVKDALKERFVDFFVLLCFPTLVPKVAKRCQQMPNVAESGHKFPKLLKSCYKLPKVTSYKSLKTKGHG